MQSSAPAFQQTNGLPAPSMLPALTGPASRIICAPSRASFERRHTLPILANVLIRKTGATIELTTSGLRIQLPNGAELGGDALNFATSGAARKVIDILRSLPADQMVARRSGTLRFVSGGT